MRRKITPENARRLAVSRQHLSGPPLSADKEGILKLFEDIGCVQIDPIRAVERTQYLVLWSRLGPYELDHFHELLWEDRELFEYWAHAASIVMVRDFAIFQRHMKDWASGDKPWSKRARAWMAENKALSAHILETLGKHGPMRSKEFKDLSSSDWVSTGWTNGQNVRLMLNYLWEQGKILVSKREGVQRLWDCPERCLPDWTPREELEWPEVVYRAVQQSLRGLGVAKPAHINQYFTRNNYPDLVETLHRLTTEGTIVPIEIAEDGRPAWEGEWFIHADDLPLLDALEGDKWQPRTTLLSPFDNLICDRERTEELFDFHFRIEIYVPKTKRKYGYYVLPILDGDRLIGRIDPQMDRRSKILTVNAIYLEPETPLSTGTGKRIIEAIEELAGFLGATVVDYTQPLPVEWSGLV